MSAGVPSCSTISYNPARTPAGRTTPTARPPAPPPPRKAAERTWRPSETSARAHTPTASAARSRHDAPIPPDTHPIRYRITVLADRQRVAEDAGGIIGSARVPAERSRRRRREGIVMAERNRVRPDGSIVAVPARGAWMGNRGCLHEGHEIVRPWRPRASLVCRLSFRGRHVAQWAPRRYTPLFFLDEAGGFA